MLHDINFLEYLLNFDKESISEETMNKLKEVFDSHPDFTIENVRKTSKAAACFFEWVHGIYDFGKIWVEIQPVRNQLISQGQSDSKNKNEEVKKEDLIKKNEEKEEEKHAEPISEADLKAQIQQKLDENRPILQKALEAINSIDMNDLRELKSLAKPPALVKLTMQCVCILLGLKPKKLADVLKNKFF